MKTKQEKQRNTSGSLMYNEVCIIIFLYFLYNVITILAKAYIVQARAS
jgi:hypothetical protein